VLLVGSLSPATKKHALCRDGDDWCCEYSQKIRFFFINNVDETAMAVNPAILD
jgi:hypothetical protein